MASPSSTYDVFLSFRGKDTRENFTHDLYTALVKKGFRTFRDGDEIARGKNIESELQDAIKLSRLSIVVLSKGFASSRWCLDELVKILQCTKDSNHEVLPVSYGVDPSKVRKQKGSYEDGFDKLKWKDRAEYDEKNEGWRAALKEVADLAGFVLKNKANGDEAKLIQEIVEAVEKKLGRAWGVGQGPTGITSQEIVEKVENKLDDTASVVVPCPTGIIPQVEVNTRGSSSFQFDPNHLGVPQWVIEQREEVQAHQSVPQWVTEQHQWAIEQRKKVQAHQGIPQWVIEQRQRAIEQGEKVQARIREAEIKAHQFQVKMKADLYEFGYHDSDSDSDSDLD